MNSSRPSITVFACVLLCSTPCLAGDFSDPIAQNEIYFTQFQTEELHQEPISSPDGHLIAYLKVDPQNIGNRRLWVMDRDGGNARPLIVESRSHIQAYPKWSPDGQLIAFSSDLGGETGIWTVHIETGVATRITDRHLGADVFAVAPTWSPDSEALAVTEYGINTGHLLKYNLSGEEPDTLCQARNIIFPAWSPDGNSILFSGETHGNGSFWILSLDSRTVEPLNSDGVIGFYPAWSPDGEWIAFQSDPGPHIYILRAKGGSPVQVTDESLVTGARTVAWDHDGESLLYSGHPLAEQDARAHLAIVDTTGQNFAILADVTQAGGAMNVIGRQTPSWSPDERFIAFTSFVEDTTISIVELTGGDVREIAPGNGQTFSPSGDEIAYVHGNALWTSSLDEVDPYPITLALPGNITHPHWSSDDEWIVFENRNTLWKVSPYGGEPNPLFEDRDLSFTVGWAENSQYFYYISPRTEGPQDAGNDGWGGLWKLATTWDSPPEYIRANVGWFTDISDDASFVTAGGMSASQGLLIQRLADGTSKRILFEEKPGHQAISPSVSPSGTRVAFYLVTEWYTHTWIADVRNLINQSVSLP